MIWLREQKRILERSRASAGTNKRKGLSLSLSLFFSRAHGHTRRQHAKKQNKEEQKKQLKNKLGPNQQYVFKKEKKNPKRDVIGAKLLLRDVIGGFLLAMA